MAKAQILLTLNDRLELANSIIDILSRGNSAQVKLRKTDIIVMEERRKIKQSTPVKQDE